MYKTNLPPKTTKELWKQRGKINWVKEGDASTRYFHAHATIRHRKNSIATLQDGAGNSFSEHEDKAKILWETFKERLGTTDFNHMLFNVNDLLIASDNLNSLEIPFSKQEIDKVVSELPNNKSPGPDGFNNEFVKGC